MSLLQQNRRFSAGLAHRTANRRRRIFRLDTVANFTTECGQLLLRTVYLSLDRPICADAWAMHTLLRAAGGNRSGHGGRNGIAWRPHSIPISTSAIGRGL